MSNVQTFEEWMEDAYGAPNASDDEFANALRQCWQAAHENAARVAYGLYLGGGSDYLHGYGDALDRAAEAIREAAK